MTRIPVCMEVPERVQTRLWYAAEELLRPLAAAPVAVERGDLGETGVYVGPSPEAAPGGALRIRHREATAASLLSEQPISTRVIEDGEVARLGDAPLPFPLGESQPLADPQEIIEIEPFASAFWWLAGVQERAFTVRDRWGRFPYEASLQARFSRTLAPPVDTIRTWLVDALRARGWDFPEPTWNGASWAVALTHDLDATRTRRLRAALGDTARGRPASALRRALGPDARRRSARALADLARRHDIRSTLFAKAGQSGPEDVRAEPERDASWLRGLADDGFEIGLHPSMQAATDGARLRAERQRLERALGRPLAAVRSHYLRWDPAVTPALYAAEGFGLDSTLGWSEGPGFRRGTAHPFRLWDADEERPSSLWEAPLAFMETPILEPLRLDPGLVLWLEPDLVVMSALNQVFEVARQVNGVAVVLWHNAMSDERLWRRTVEVLDELLGRARDQGASFVTLSEAVGIAASRVDPN
ncbi:MAG: hypothetical protein AAFQ43_07440 [Bacteroidota bacterium]